MSNVQIRSTYGSGKWNYNFPTLKQPSNNSCWATSMACILQGYGSNISPNQVINTTKNSSTSNYTDVKKYFSTYYKYSSSSFNERALSLSNIASEINSGRAIYQDLISSTYSGHTVVVMGYQYGSNTQSGFVTFMDPAYAKYYDSEFADNHFTHNSRRSITGLYKIIK